MSRIIEKLDYREVIKYPLLRDMHLKPLAMNVIPMQPRKIRLQISKELHFLLKMTTNQEGRFLCPLSQISMQLMI